jgi:hypothetical protein
MSLGWHKMQTVRCHSMTKDTADFPMYDITKAVQEVKDDAPEKTRLCKIAKFQASSEDKLTA